jgi:hypothetical protein
VIWGDLGTRNELVPNETVPLASYAGVSFSSTEAIVCLSAGEVLGIVGVVLALGVPIGIEWARRPSLRIEIGVDANSADPLWRIVHVRIVNKPLQGFPARFLLRNSAAACHVTMEFVSQSDGTRLPASGKWSARPEPLATVPVDSEGLGLRRIFDPEKIPQALTLDVSPTAAGEPVAVAIKHNGDPMAYAFDPAIYAYLNLRNDALALPHERYDVNVTVQAGEIKAEPRRFVLHNDGTEYRDLRLEPT